MVLKKITRNKNIFNYRLLTWPPVVTFSVIFIIYLVVSLLRLDPDFGWHLKSGEYFLAHGIPATDIFTYTASDFPWINHEWLTDIFTSIIYSCGGYFTLSAFYSALWTLAIWLVGRKAHNLTLILAVLATVPFAGVRAITWSVLGLALLTVIIKSKNHRYRWFIPLIFLAWANIHGSFVIGFAYLIYMAFKQRSWQIIAPTCIGALLTLVNPYGFGIYTEIIRTAGDSSLRWRITEWSALLIPWMTIPYVLLWASGFALTGLKDWRKYLGIDSILFIASVTSMRMFPLFTIMSLGTTDERLRTIAAIIPKNLDKPRRRFITVIGILIALAVLTTIVIDYRGVSIDRERNYPKNAVNYLQQHPCDGTLFNNYNYGGYLIWKLPSVKVYIDGRMPSWELNGRKYMDDYLSILKNEDVRKEQLAKYNIRCALMMRDNDKVNIVDDLKKNRWKIVAEDPDSVLLLHP